MPVQHVWYKHLSYISGTFTLVMQFAEACDFILKKLAIGLAPEYSYHNADHTRDVYEAADRLSGLEQIDDYEKKLLLTAAAYHDSGFLVKADGHEEESCKMAKDILPGFGYLKEEINTICGLIEATKLPQTPQNHLGQILADADLDYLGRDDFDQISGKLFQELKNRGLIDNQENWDRAQVKFLESHAYFTPSAINLRNAGKQARLQAIKNTISTNLK